MKAYTDLEQSKKLAEILPLESADMYLDYNVHCQKYKYYLRVMDDQFDDVCIPCWSLAALIKVLPSIEGFKPVIDLDINQIRYEGKYRDELYFDSENLIDACYEMILKLHEQNLL